MLELDNLYKKKSLDSVAQTNKNVSQSRISYESSSINELTSFFLLGVLLVGLAKQGQSFDGGGVGGRTEGSM